MLSPEQKATIIVAVGDAAAALDRRSDHLHRAIVDAVDVLKSQGWQPERIIVYLREIVSASPDARRFPYVSERIAEWCLRRYYGPVDLDEST
jgi:hypothetical protein